MTPRGNRHKVEPIARQREPHPARHLAQSGSCTEATDIKGRFSRRRSYRERLGSRVVEAIQTLDAELAKATGMDPGEARCSGDASGRRILDIVIITEEPEQKIEERLMTSE
jgi:hypothetical protein